MTVLYPRERVKEVLRPLSLATAHRIVLKPYLSDPLTVRSSKSRFCDGRTYAVLYAVGSGRTQVPVHGVCYLNDLLPTLGSRHGDSPVSSLP